MSDNKIISKYRYKLINNIDNKQNHIYLYKNTLLFKIISDYHNNSKNNVNIMIKHITIHNQSTTPNMI